MGMRKHAIWLLLAMGLLVRLLAFFYVDYMFVNDIRTFQLWATNLAENGLGNFYTGGVWSDYPPGFLYVLALLGFARGIFGWETLDPVFNFFTFLPAILADLGVGYVIFRLAKGKTMGNGFSALITALWVFNPAIILISSVWGQVESVFLLPLFLSLVLLRDRKLLPAYLLYGAAILIKPQSLFLGPVYLFSAFDYLREHKYILPAVKRLGLYLFAAMGSMLVLVLPFTRGFDLMPVLRQFWGGLDSYNYGSVNAFNFWALAGRNWQPLDARFMGITHALWGVIVATVIIAAALAALELDKRRGGGRFWLIVAGVFALTFVFSVKMHERYMFPALLFLLLYALEKPRWYTFGLFAAACATFYLNCIAVLHTYHAGWDFAVLDRYIMPVSWANIGVAAWLMAAWKIANKRGGNYGKK
jgi:Gpi18-like mannosyltransferase